MKPSLLIVEDDEDIRSQLNWALVNDYDVSLAGDRPTALALFREKRPAVVLLDLGLPPHPASPEEGLAALTELLASEPLTKVIIASGQAEKTHALRAIGQGAYDFLSKPVQMDELQVILKRVFHVAQLERECRDLQQRMGGDAFEGMLGGSPSMQEVFASIRKVATTDASVLILGESGTGKEMVAQAIHRCSARKTGPFVPINCGAIPENLLESELFGHEKGSFTGAHTQRKGRIESADGGTLFLDEIGELPPLLQVKLLRFLQEQTLERVGGRTRLQINTRVLAATNRDLKQAMAQNQFREDLYYRLAVVSLRLAPLRERPDDIALLARAFLQRFGSETKRENLRFDPRALHAMQQHAWPGNVRELENRVKRAVIMAEGWRVTAADLELTDALAAAPPITLRDAREAVERQLVQQALERHRGKIAPAAADLGISRPTFYELMGKLGLKRDPAA
jgi:two-component system NtrC family response regulator